MLTPKETRDCWYAYLDAVRPIVEARLRLRDACLPRISVKPEEGLAGLEVLYPPPFYPQDATLEELQALVLNRCFGS